MREGTVALAVSLLAAEMWLADQYLGTLMIVTLIILVIGVLLYGSLASDRLDARATRARNETDCAHGAARRGRSVGRRLLRVQEPRGRVSGKPGGVHGSEAAVERRIRSIACRFPGGTLRCRPRRSRCNRR